MNDLPVAAIVLAAGQSSRLGQPKQLVRLAGEPLLCRTVRLALAAGCSPVIVVLGAAEGRCRSALEGIKSEEHGSTRLQIVTNAKWPQGMSTSLKAGLQVLISEAEAGERAAALVLVSDQLRLTGDSIARLLHAYRQGGRPLTAARYDGHLGVPAIFEADLWPALLALTGDRGARSLLASWAEQTVAVDLPEAAFELDTPEELAALLAAEAARHR